MTSIIKVKRVFPYLVLLFLCGCMSVKTVPYETIAWSRKPDNFPIEILDSRNITEPYKVIAFVQANAGKNHSFQDTLEKLRAAARKIGADALAWIPMLVIRLNTTD